MWNRSRLVDQRRHCRAPAPPSDRYRWWIHNDSRFRQCTCRRQMVMVSLSTMHDSYVRFRMLPPCGRHRFRSVIEVWKSWEMSWTVWVIGENFQCNTDSKAISGCLLTTSDFMRFVNATLPMNGRNGLVMLHENATVGIKIVHFKVVCYERQSFENSKCRLQLRCP